MTVGTSRSSPTTTDPRSGAARRSGLRPSSGRSLRPCFSRNSPNGPTNMTKSNSNQGGGGGNQGGGNKGGGKGGGGNVPNLPSTTGNQSGGGRGNNPPKK